MSESLYSNYNKVSGYTSQSYNELDCAAALASDIKSCESYYVLKNDKDYREMMKLAETIRNEHTNTIVKFEIIVPDKVVKVFFQDGKYEKMICREDDTFDLRKCLFIAMAKHWYKDKYTYEGIEKMAYELSMEKAIVKNVDSVLKTHFRELKEKEMADHREKENKLIEERRKEKLKAKKRKLKEKKLLEEKELQIEIQKEAFVRAFKELVGNATQ